MWSPELSKGYEVRKCRHRVISFCRGVGVDIGCGDEKICEQAIGIDRTGEKADIHLDLSANDSLRIFSDCYFDYVFSSHVLEDFMATEAILREWWRVVKFGGYLILYCPDPDYYPRIGTDGSNPAHQKDLYWQDVWEIIKGFGNARLIASSRHNESNEYSWMLVVQKKNGFLRKPFEQLFGTNHKGSIAFPRKKITNKECLIIRYGAIGDAIWMTPVLRQLKKDGYYIVYNCTDYSAQVLRNNPNIDEFLIQEKDAITGGELDEYWKKIGDGFEKVLNFSGSVEGKLLVSQTSEEFNWSHNKRHTACNQNYQDRTMEVAGYPKLKGQQPELFFSEDEEILAQMFRANLKGRFAILWSLAGSAFHKGYPWSPYVAGELQKKYKDIVIITVGDNASRLIEWDMPNTVNKSGVFTVRQSMILTKYVDLVVGPETGILNAASCFDTPKIVLLSHSSVENLTKYWRNCSSLKPKDCNCYPCHILHFSSANICARGKHKIAAACMENIHPKEVYSEIEKYYLRWKNDHIGIENTDISQLA
jgi:ADP-heptose:LPS heptosyltransferase